LLLPIAIRSLFERREANRKVEKAASACRDLMKELKSTEATLEDKIRVLDQIGDAVVHRELKIVELEKQVDRLRDEVKRLKG
jgi:acetolactate synthase small subunit